jgi:hypothetical protein
MASCVPCLALMARPGGYTEPNVAQTLIHSHTGGRDTVVLVTRAVIHSHSHSGSGSGLRASGGSWRGEVLDAAISPTALQAC